VCALMIRLSQQKVQLSHRGTRHLHSIALLTCWGGAYKAGRKRSHIDQCPSKGYWVPSLLRCQERICEPAQHRDKCYIRVIPALDRHW
jgi:hypothetical protein